MACGASGRWSVLVGVAGTTTWPPPASATSGPMGWSMWTGGAGAAMWSPHPAATPRPPLPVDPRRDLETPLAEVPRLLRARLEHRAPQRSRGPVELPATGANPGDRYAQAALAQELARVATAPVGQRNRQLWESARNLYNLVTTGALDHREVDHELLAAAERCGLLDEEPRQTHRTLASGRQVGLAHPGRPRQPTSPERTHASPPLRAAGERTKEGR